MAQTLPGRLEDGRDARDVVERELHHEGRGLAHKERMLQEQAREDGQDDAGEVDGEDHRAAGRAEEGRAEEGVDRQTRAAAHEGRHEDGEQTIAAVAQRARGHDGRHRAPEAHEHRHEGAARQSQETHEAVHHERRAGHVTGVLEQREAQEDEEDRRDEGHHRLDAHAQAVGQQRDEPGGQAAEGEHVAQAGDEEGVAQAVKEVDEAPADHLGEPEEEVHHQQEERDAQPAVQRDAIERAAQLGAGVADLTADVLGELGNLRVTGVGDQHVGGGAQSLLDVGNDVLGAGQDALQTVDGEHLGLVLAGHTVQGVNQRGRHLHARGLLARGQRLQHGALEGHAGGTPLHVARHNGHAQTARQLRDVDLETLTAQDVGHREDHDHRLAQLHQRQGEIEVALQVHRVDHVDDQVGLAAAGVIRGHALILRHGMERIHARKVHQDQLLAAGQGNLAQQLLNSDARPVAGHLVHARPGIEEGRFAGVGVAGQRGGDGALLAHSATSFNFRMLASSLRNDNSKPRTRKRNGSPIGATPIN